MSSSSLRRLAFLCAACSIGTASPCRADVALPNCISDHMVLQRDAQVPLWGTAKAGEKVTVTFRDQKKTTTADDAGNWRVELDPLAAGGPDELVVAGDNQLTRTDVLVGEVWVGSGQSNMAGAVNSYLDNDPELKKLKFAGPYPQIRLLKSNGTWAVATVNDVGGHSALLFPFGEKLHRELGVPVGLMLGAVGGTPSGAWLTKEMLAENAAVQPLLAKYEADYPETLQTFETRTLPAILKAIDKLKAEGKPVPRQPSPPPKPGMLNGNREIGYLFEAHIRPFLGYGIRGVLWDQGESGTALGGVDQYTAMGALIAGWRKAWNVGEFPFIYVQKPSGGGCAWTTDDPVTSRGQAFSELPANVPATNEGLNVALHIRIMTYPNVGMVISSDLGPGIHPANKSGYGRRGADVALGLAYGRKAEYYGPVYDSHTDEGNKIRVKFSHAASGLTYRHGDKLQGFAVAGDDQEFHWADAVIDGDAVVVSSPEVKTPVAVRYAWGTNRTWANLFNNDRLPAVPFRTDVW
jgi:sialate O-acetylesterase